MIDEFCFKNFSADAKFFGQLRGHFLAKYKYYYAMKDLEETIYLPFERIEIPAPAGYEDCLTSQYGDWREAKIFNKHARVFSADFPFKDFFGKVDKFE